MQMGRGPVKFSFDRAEIYDGRRGIVRRQPSRVKVVARSFERVGVLGERTFEMAKAALPFL